jgi:hypothetical protein
MSSSVPKAGKHRATSHRVRRALTGLSLATAVTGVAVTGGLVADQQTTAAVAANVAHQPVGAITRVATTQREEVVSRSADEIDTEKLETLTVEESPAAAYEEDLSDADPRTIARVLLPEYGFSADQFGCLDALYVSESDWRIDADNPTSSAYGIPQALTETHDMPPGYFTSAEVQIRWGLDYIRDSYGSPCSAWEFKQANNWY